MNSFHRNNILSAIQESHQVPIQADWAYVIRKQARFILLPLFREVYIRWEESNTGKRPYLTELVEELYMGFFQNGSVRMSIHSQLEKIISKFLTSLEKQEIAILGFYFLSKQAEVDAIYQEIDDLEGSEYLSAEEDEREVGKVFQERAQNMSLEDLTGYLMGEMGEVENILSDSDVRIGLETEAITRINESFSDYLDLPYGEISLIQYPVYAWDFWERVMAEKPETVGKRIHTVQGLEWVECWLLPDGRIRIKGDFLDEPERNQAAVQAIKLELPVILKAVHQQLINHYGLFDSHIHYTFFTRRKSLENIVPAEGIQFFVDQIQGHGADDFRPCINVDIRRYKNKDLQEWGTQISLGVDDRHWLSEDEYQEFKVWVFSMEGEETPLEVRLSEKQVESIVRSIIGNIHNCYQQEYENN